MKQITTIIFDLGGVVLNNDWHDGNETKFNQYKKLFDITYDDMERGWRKASLDYQLGRISEDEFWSIFLTEAGANRINADKAKQLWRRNVSEIESMLSLLKKLKKRYKLAALTTIGKEWLNYKTNKYNLNDYFNIIVSSGDSGLAKPDPKIYEMVLKNLGVTGEECIFIDDLKETLPPAEKLGINSILFKSQKELEEKLESMGVL